MKAILMSIRPKWCELIASGKKTVEIRKNRPKLKTPNEPFKVYIYMSAGDAIYPVTINGASYTCSNNGGKCVIGEFVCDKISVFRPKSITCESAIKKASCLTVQGLVDYAGKQDHIFGWHISDLVIYDKPKPLKDFAVQECLWHNIRNNGCIDASGERCYDCRLKRPPQSWCYVEED